MINKGIIHYLSLFFDLSAIYIKIKAAPKIVTYDKIIVIRAEIFIAVP